MCLQKAKTYYAVLSDRAIQLFESEKARRKKKNGKHIFDLFRCFNVSIQVCFFVKKNN
jgi:hypothetical protein